MGFPGESAPQFQVSTGGASVWWVESVRNSVLVPKYKIGGQEWFTLFVFFLSFDSQGVSWCWFATRSLYAQNFRCI